MNDYNNFLENISTGENVYYSYNTSSTRLDGFSGTITIDDPGFIKDFKRAFNPYEIKKVVVNPEKEATTVIFTDGTVEIVKKSPEDPEADIFSVVAYAVAKRVYGSNSAFKREVVNKVEIMKFKEKKHDASIESLTKAIDSLAKTLKGVKK